MDRSEVMATIRSLLEGHASELIAAYVFGSLARGEDSVGSDSRIVVSDVQDLIVFSDEIRQSLRLP